MRKKWSWPLHLDATKFIAVVIAIILWALVRGQGIGSLSVDAPLQIQGLSSQLMIINDLPDRVRVTISGPQTRLSELGAHDVRAPLDASRITGPGVEEIALNVDDIKLPAGLKVERVQPDRVVLQIDRVIERKIRIEPRVEVPQGWKVSGLEVIPPDALLKGPEVWLDALSTVKTPVIHPEAKAGEFKVSVGVESPAGKAIRLVKPDEKFRVRGRLDPEPLPEAPPGSSPKGSVPSVAAPKTGDGDHPVSGGH
jgi:hypothetical protein